MPRACWLPPTRAIPCARTFPACREVRPGTVLIISWCAQSRAVAHFEEVLRWNPHRPLRAAMRHLSLCAPCPTAGATRCGLVFWQISARGALPRRSTLLYPLVFVLSSFPRGNPRCSGASTRPSHPRAALAVDRQLWGAGAAMEEQQGRSAALPREC